MEFWRALKQVSQAAKKLSDGQGRVARRNVRNDVLEALRCVRNALDEEYKVERKAAKVRRQKSNEFSQNYAEIQPHTKRFGQLLKAGIRIIIKQREVKIIGTNLTSLKTLKGDVFYAPRWAVFAPPDTTIEQFKKARRSRTEQAALSTLGQLIIEDRGTV